MKASGEQFNRLLVMATRQNKYTGMARSLCVQGVIEVRSAQGTYYSILHEKSCYMRLKMRVVQIICFWVAIKVV